MSNTVQLRSYDEMKTFAIEYLSDSRYNTTYDHRQFTQDNPFFRDRHNSLIDETITMVTHDEYNMHELRWICNKIYDTRYSEHVTVEESTSVKTIVSLHYYIKCLNQHVIRQ